MDRLQKDIEFLKGIYERLKENYDDDEWDLSEHERIELYRITNLEDHDWDDSNIAYYIDGMQRTLFLQLLYKKDTFQDNKEKNNSAPTEEKHNG